MHGIIRNICLNQPDQTFCNKILIIDLFYWLKNKGVMGQKHIRPGLYSRLDHLISGIQGNINFLNLFIASACQQSSIIPFTSPFLRRQPLEKIDYLNAFHPVPPLSIAAPVPEPYRLWTAPLSLVLTRRS